MRAFAAIELSRDARGALAELQERLRDRRLSARWVRADSLHLTIRFLGGKPEAGHRAYVDCLCEALRGFTALTLHVASPGIFPASGAPRVLWIGLRCEGGALEEIARRCESAAVSSGYPPEARRFRPHVTLARARDDVRSGDRIAWEGAMAEAVSSWAVPAPFAVREIVVFESRLGGGAPIYVPLATIPLPG